MLFSVYAKWLEACACVCGGGCSVYSSRVVDRRDISGLFKTCAFSLAGLCLEGGQH